MRFISPEKSGKRNTNYEGKERNPHNSFVPQWNSLKAGAKGRGKSCVRNGEKNVKEQKRQKKESNEMTLN